MQHMMLSCDRHGGSASFYCTFWSGTRKNAISSNQGDDLVSGGALLQETVTGKCSLFSIPIDSFKAAYFKVHRGWTTSKVYPTHFKSWCLFRCFIFFMSLNKPVPPPSKTGKVYLAFLRLIGLIGYQT